MLKYKLASATGSIVEWYDFALYGYFGALFSQIFFPASMPAWLSLVATYGIFAIGYVARPMGALIFGYLGDRYGRVYVLKITPILISIATAAIGLLPEYKTMGIATIFLLLSARFAQGIFLGGEFAGNIVYLCESSPKSSYCWGSIASCTGSLGIMLASATISWVYSSFNHIVIENYIWRATFLSAIPFGCLVYYLRRNMLETQAYSAIRQNMLTSNPLKKAYSLHKKPFFLALGIVYLHATSFYFVFVFIPLFLSTYKKIPEASALVNNTGFLLLHIMLIPLFGYLSQKLGGKRMQQVAALLFISLSYWLFCGVNSNNQECLKWYLLGFSILTSINAGVVPGLLAETLPLETRYTLLAFCFNIGFGVFGGLAPVLCLLLASSIYGTISPVYYLIFTGIITLAITFFLQNKSGAPHAQ
jgi:MHS family proline/betaine transporter-like MFS transporter